jgi:GNAT superfamily N-acetyltransferase
MKIRRVDPDDDSVVAYHALQVEADQHDNPCPTPFSVQEQRELLRNQDSSVRVEGYLGLDGNTPVATGSVELFMSDNTDKAFVEAQVAPTLRGRGYGTAMIEFLLDLARRADRTTVMTVVTYPRDADESHPSRMFAIRQGFAFSQADVHRVLRLPVDDDLLARRAAEAADRHSAYTLVDFVGLPPEQMREAYCVLLNQIITDAPTGDVDFEEGRTTPDHLVEREAVMKASGRTAYTTVALDHDGVPVAHNVLVVPTHDPANIFNWDTMVLRAHRGRRLGIATKIRNLRNVVAAHSERTAIHTWNAESNAPMIAVNEAMGFEPVAFLGEYVRTLTP